MRLQLRNREPRGNRVFMGRLFSIAYWDLDERVMAFRRVQQQHLEAVICEHERRLLYENDIPPPYTAMNQDSPFDDPPPYRQ